MYHNLTISHNTLCAIFSRFSIELPPQKLILFAFRGMLVSGKISRWEASVVLTPAKVDYRHLRCVAGIWNIHTKKIFAAPGSTVPYIEWVNKSVLRHGKGANQLEPGFYTDFRKGDHLEGTPRAHAALRQTAKRFIRRTITGAPYKKNDRLIFSNPYDNLHCAGNESLDIAGFNSAGCIVVAGIPHCPGLKGYDRNKGPWKFFHDAIYSASQSQFSLLLLDGLKVKSAPALQTSHGLLCYGSSGKIVKELQRKLKDRGVYKGPINGWLDSRTYKSWKSIS